MTRLMCHDCGEPADPNRYRINETTGKHEPLCVKCFEKARAMSPRSKGSLYELNLEEDPGLGPGRRRLEITCREKGVVVFHKAGPSNIVLGLYKKFLEEHPSFRVEPRHG